MKKSSVKPEQDFYLTIEQFGYYLDRAEKGKVHDWIESNSLLLASNYNLECFAQNIRIPLCVIADIIGIDAVFEIFERKKDVYLFDARRFCQILLNDINPELLCNFPFYENEIEEYKDKGKCKSLSRLLGFMAGSIKRRTIGEPINGEAYALGLVSDKEAIKSFNDGMAAVKFQCSISSRHLELFKLFICNW